MSPKLLDRSSTSSLGYGIPHENIANSVWGGEVDVFSEWIALGNNIQIWPQNLSKNSCVMQKRGLPD